MASRGRSASAQFQERADTWPMRPGSRPDALHAALTRTIVNDIQEGRYPVGAMLPSEDELRMRFGVSRHTVRNALQQLKSLGIVSSHPGIGTIVARQPAPPRIVQALSTSDELSELYKRTKLRVSRIDSVTADRALAEELGCEPGHEWSRSRLLRYVPDNPLPIAFALVYLRPEYADVAPMINRSKLPVFELLVKRHGIQLVEIRQRIAAIALTEDVAGALHAATGAPALRVTRHFVGPQGRVVEVSVSTYPSERFEYVSSFQLELVTKRSR